MLGTSSRLGDPLTLHAQEGRERLHFCLKEAELAPLLRFRQDSGRLSPKALEREDAPLVVNRAHDQLGQQRTLSVEVEPLEERNGLLLSSEVRHHPVLQLGPLGSGWISFQDVQRGQIEG